MKKRIKTAGIIVSILSVIAIILLHTTFIQSIPIVIGCLAIFHTAMSTPTEEYYGQCPNCGAKINMTPSDDKKSCRKCHKKIISKDGYFLVKD